MARRRPETTLITAASTHQRQTRLTLTLAMLAFLGIVVFAGFQMIPEGGLAKFRARPVESRMSRAAEYEKQSLDRSAAEEYAAALADERLDEPTRYAAALRLVRIEQDRLNDPKSAEAALEKAWLLAPDADRPALASRIQTLRGYPVETAELASIDAKTLLKSDAAAQGQAAQGRTIVAQVGDQAVTMEDLIYAWSQTHANQPPESAEFGPFVSNYLNMTLLADQAQRLGLDQQGRTSLLLRMSRTLSLSRAMEEALIAKLSDPSEEQLRSIYEANPSDWALPPRMKIGHIVVADEDRVETVERALKGKDSFAETARRFSRDEEKLEEGYLLGEIAEADETIPHLGNQPGLASVLFELEDGQTTGPLKLTDGYHWFKAVAKEKTGQPAPFNAVRDQIALRFQQGALARARAAMLAKLRAERPIAIRDAALSRMMAGASVSTRTLNASSPKSPAQSEPPASPAAR